MSAIGLGEHLVEQFSIGMSLQVSADKFSDEEVSSAVAAWNIPLGDLPTPLVRKHPM